MEGGLSEGPPLNREGEEGDEPPVRSAEGDLGTKIGLARMALSGCHSPELCKNPRNERERGEQISHLKLPVER